MDITVLIVNSLAVLVAVVGLIITSVQFKKTTASTTKTATSCLANMA